MHAIQSLRQIFILALRVQDKCYWTGYGQPQNYGQHKDKKTGFVHTLSIRMFVVIHEKVGTHQNHPPNSRKTVRARSACRPRIVRA